MRGERKKRESACPPAALRSLLTESLRPAPNYRNPRRSGAEAGAEPIANLCLCLCSALSSADPSAALGSVDLSTLSPFEANESRPLARPPRYKRLAAAAGVYCGECAKCTEMPSNPFSSSRAAPRLAFPATNKHNNGSH